MSEGEILLTPADFVALFSATGGSFYGAIKKDYWPNTYEFRLIVSLQASTIFLVAFASMDYIGPSAGSSPALAGVRWTASFLSTALPVFIYLIVLLLLMLGAFHGATFLLSRISNKMLETKSFAAGALLLYLAVGIHALTIDVVPVDMASLR